MKNEPTCQELNAENKLLKKELYKYNELQSLNFLDNISFTDLFDIDEFQEIQDNFAEATGVASIITYPDGTPITKPSNFCRLCNDIIRKTKKGLKNCYYSDAVIGRQNKKGAIYQPCLSGGLWDAGASITVGDKHIANWLIGQVRNKDIDIDKMLLYAKEIEANEIEFKQALEEVSVMSVKQFKKVADTLFVFAKEMSGKAYQNILKSQLISELRAEKEAHLRTAVFNEKIVHSSPIGMAIYNSDGNCVVTNEAFALVIGANQNLVLQQNYHKIESWKKSGLYEIALTAIKDKKKKRYEINIETTFGIKTILDCFVVPVDIKKEMHLLLMIDDISKQKQSEKINKHKLELETMLNEISIHFVNAVGEGIDDAINQTLEKIAHLTGAEQSSFFVLSDDLEIMINTHEWCAVPKASKSKVLPDVPFLNFEYHQKELLNNKTILISKLEDYPMDAKKEREWITKYGFRSLLFVPLFKQRKLYGAIGFYSKKEEGIFWPVEFVDILKTIGNIIINVLKRKHAEEKLRSTNKNLKNISDALKKANDELIIALEDTKKRYELENINEKLRKHEQILIKAHKKLLEKKVQLEELNKNLRISEIESLQLNEELTTAYEQLYSQKEELETTFHQLKETQTQLIQSEKMASLGVLTAGIAHEINNPINFIYTGINSLQKDFDDINVVLKEIVKLDVNDDNLRDRVSEIEKIKEEYYFNDAYEGIPETIDDIRLGAIRTAEIVKGLRNFSRTDENDRSFFDIHEGIDAAILLLKNKHKSQIELQKKYDISIPKIECFPGKLNQVFMNIISNAIDAIDDKGKITISTKVVDNNVIVSIKDTGHGISDEIQSRIFDPFFTTKVVGKGTGLGLAISYGIIKEHNGVIKIRSKIGKGTEFFISLPVQK